MAKTFKKIVSLVWNLRPWGLTPGKVSDLTSRCRNILRSHDIKVKLVGEIPSGSCILVANHLSYFDPIIIKSFIPSVPIAKSETANWPLFGRCMKKSGVLFYERGNPWSGYKVLKQASDKLLLGNKVLVFPEGTTTAGKEVMPFKRGIFGLSKLTGVPIVPITLQYEDPDCCWWEKQDTFGAHYSRQLKKNKIVVRMHVGKKYYCYEKEQVESFKDWIWSVISQELSKQRNYLS